MDNLFTAIMTKTSGSSLSTDVGGRIFLDEALDGTEYPYIVFFIVSGIPEKTFTEHYTDTLLQFSMFSASKGATEITTMYADLKSLFDEAILPITDSTMIWMKEQHLTTMMIDIMVKKEARRGRHWAVDFEILTSLD